MRDIRTAKTRCVRQDWLGEHWPGMRVTLLEQSLLSLVLVVLKVGRLAGYRVR